jgi:hypothetical protein
VSGGRVSWYLFSCAALPRSLKLLLFFERNREMMFDMEKPCSELEGSRTAILLRVC